MKKAVSPKKVVAQDSDGLVLSTVASEEVRFYRSNERPYGVFSNLYRRAIVFEGIEYPTSEHAYQAGKPRKDAVREWILSAPSPALVAMAAHGLYTWDIVPNWSKIKFDRMRQVLKVKFTQHEDLQEILLSTGNARLVESATVDNEVNRTWGEVNGKGKNMLGVLLMELRQELLLERGKAKNSKKNSTEGVGEVSNTKKISRQKKADPQHDSLPA